MNPRFRRAFRIIIALALGLAAALAALVAALHTPPGKRILANRIGAMATQFSPYAVAIEDIRGTIPFNLRVGRVTLGDHAGRWLEIEEAHVRLHAAPLLRGRVHIGVAAAEQIVLERLPETPPDAPEAPWAAPAIPAYPAWLRISAARFPSIRLGDAVLGEAAVFALEGVVQPGETPGSGEVTAKLERTDAETTRIALDGAIGGGRLSVHLDAHDDGILPPLLCLDGPAEALLTGDGPLDDWRGALSARVGGRSLLDSELRLAITERIHAEIEVRTDLTHPLLPEDAARWLGAELGIASKITFVPGDAIEIEHLSAAAATAEARLHGKIDADLSSLDLHIEARHADASRFAPDIEAETPIQLTLHAAGGRADLEVRGEALLDDADLLEVQATLQLEDGVSGDAAAVLHPPAALLPEGFREALASGIRLETHAAFTPERIALVRGALLEIGNATLRADLSLDTGTDALEGSIAAAVPDAAHWLPAEERPIQSGALDMLLEITGDASATAINLTAEASGIALDNARAGGARLRAEATAGPWRNQPPEELAAQITGALFDLAFEETPLPPVEFALNLTAEDLDRIVINEMLITDGNARITAHGAIAPAPLSVDLDAQAEVADLGAISRLAGLPYAGHIGLTLSARTPDDGEGVLGTLNGAWRNPSGLPEPAGALLAPELRIEADYALRPESLKVARLHLVTPHARAEATAGYVFETRDITGTVQASAPDLAAAGAAAGLDLAGRLEVEAAASGTAGAIEIQAEASGSELRYANFGADRLRATIDAEVAGDETHAAAALDLDRDDARIEARARSAYRGETVFLESLTVALGPNRLDASGLYAPAANTLSGTLDLDFPDLAPLGAIAGAPLTGTLAGEAAIEMEDGMTGLRFETRGEDISAPFAALRQFRAAGEASDLLGAPSGTIRLEATGLGAEAVELASLNAEASGDLELLRARVETHGDVSGATLALALELDAQPGESAAVLRMFEGDLGGYPLQLEQPARAAWTPDSARLDPVRLRFAEAMISLEGHMDSDAAAFRAEWRDFPAAAAGLFSDVALQGLLEGGAAIQGDPAAPVITLELAASGLRLAELAPDAPSMDARIDARLGAGRLEAGARAELGAAGEATLNMAIPLTVSLRPWSIDAEDEIPLEGALGARIDLAELPAMLGLDTHQAQGVAEASFTLGGVHTAPELAGGARLTDGRYENTELGVILGELGFEAEAEGRQVRITRIDARDGAGGSIEGRGAVDLDPARRFPIDAEMRFERMRVVHRDDVSTRLTGPLSIAGDLDKTTVTGDLVIGPADINLPQRLPAARMATVEVTEVRGGPSHAGPAPPGAPGASAIQLDMRVGAPNRVFVRGSGLDSEWRADLRIRGAATAPAITGELNVVKGHLTVFGRRFDFEEGAAIFDGAYPPNPYLRVRAAARTQDVLARLSLEGTPDELELSLSSEPALPEDEILARVLFGRDISEISPIQALELAQYAAMLSGRLGGGLGALGSLRRAAGLDRLEVRQGAATGETAIGMGAYLGEDIYVELEQGAGLDSSRVSVQVEITPRIRVEAETSAGARSGFGIFWKRDY